MTCDVVGGAFDVEAAAYAGEFGEAFAMRSLGLEIESDGGSGGGVANIVNAGDEGAEKAEVFAFVGEAEFAAEALVLDIADDQVGLGGDA